MKKFFDKHLTDKSKIKYVQSNKKSLKLKCYIAVMLLLINKLSFKINSLIKVMKMTSQEYLF